MGCKWEESCNYPLHQKMIKELQDQGCSPRWVKHFTALCQHRFELRHLEMAKEAILKFNEKPLDKDNK